MAVHRQELSEYEAVPIGGFASSAEVFPGTQHEGLLRPVLPASDGIPDLLQRQPTFGASVKVCRLAFWAEGSLLVLFDNSGAASRAYQTSGFLNPLWSISLADTPRDPSLSHLDYAC